MAPLIRWSRQGDTNRKFNTSSTNRTQKEAMKKAKNKAKKAQKPTKKKGVSMLDAAVIGASTPPFGAIGEK